MRKIGAPYLVRWVALSPYSFGSVPTVEEFDDFKDARNRAASISKTVPGVHVDVYKLVHTFYETTPEERARKEFWSK